MNLSFETALGAASGQLEHQGEASAVEAADSASVNPSLPDQTPSGPGGAMYGWGTPLSGI